MTISYNWLSNYLPETIAPERLSKILTSVGLEVESLEKYESVKGGLQGLLVGEVLECTQHPNADKLKITTVNTGSGTLLQIVCGASNVAVGQKVIVATAGTTIYPLSGDPLTMKVTKIRGTESQGMICAEDEIGFSNNHDGIMVLPQDTKTGLPAAEYFKPYEDWIFEIGLTPNRMDAMSHIGVARDVCAYLSHNNNSNIRPILPSVAAWKIDNTSLPIEVVIENTVACERYVGVSISGITVKESPQWLKNALLSIGVRSINNIVDVTNYILHSNGQPLHAFDAAVITGNKIVVKNLPDQTVFTTLDEKERKINDEDLMICNEEEAMCIAGVFGGIKSGVTSATTNIFLESAWFNPVSIRKSSFRHGLRTDAATRFEKGVDISNTVNVLKQAALLIKEVAGGEISSEIIDIYPNPKPRKDIIVKYHYLKKLSGKNYHPDVIKRILTVLNFEVVKEGIDEISLTVPYSKPDINLPADVAEEILRIDGLDNISIPSSITLTPSTETLGIKDTLREKICNILVGKGFYEIMTNSITNSKYYDEKILETAVKMINNLSTDLDIMRPSMLETGLEAISHNVNRQHGNLRFFEFGKTYTTPKAATYTEKEYLCLYLTGVTHQDNWNQKAKPIDFYTAKGIVSALLYSIGIKNICFEKNEDTTHSLQVDVYYKKQLLCSLIEVGKKQLQLFDIKQPVYYVNIDFAAILQQFSEAVITYKELAKFPIVQRDLAIVTNKQTTYQSIEAAISGAKIAKLQDVRLFDVFESEKLGADKKSMAINFTFLDEEKTLTDKEIDTFMQKITGRLEKDLAAEIRK